MTRIEGFWIYWGSEHYVWAERRSGRPRRNTSIGSRSLPIGDRLESYGSGRLTLLTKTPSKTRSGLQNRQKKPLRSSCGRNSGSRRRMKKITADVCVRRHLRVQPYKALCAGAPLRL